MEKRSRHIVAVLLALLLMIATVPIIGTESDLALAGSSGAKLIGVIHDDQGVDEDGDGLFDYLMVGVQVNVTESGIYRVSIYRLVSSDSSYIYIYADKSMYLDVDLQVVNVSLHGPIIYLSGLNPANVSEISLYEDGNWLETVRDLPLSQVYLYNQFDPPGASLTGIISDEGRDADADGFFDYLDVSVEINVTDAGTYRVEVSGLRGSQSNYIGVYDYESRYLEADLHEFNLSLNGEVIHASGLNPRYVASIYLYDENYNVLGRLYDVSLPTEYSYTEFDVPPPPQPVRAKLTGNITDEGVDSDLDGLFDYLKVGVGIDVNASGKYRINVYGLRNNSDYIDVSGSELGYFDVGVHVLDVLLFGPTIRISGLNSSFVDSIYLYDENYGYLDSRYHVSLSKEYLFTQFDYPGAVLTEVVKDSGVDSDDDEKFDYLDVGVEINVTEAGTYQIRVSGLLDKEMNYIPVSAYLSTYLSNGTQTVYVSLDGLTIYNSGLNPKLINEIYLRDEKDHYLGRLQNIPLSKEYSYTEFEHPPAALTGFIIDDAVDRDGDGFCDDLEIGVQVNVTESGTYEVHVSGLMDDELNRIDISASASASLDIGEHLVNVSLHGPTIYVSGLNPRLVAWFALYQQYPYWNYLGSMEDIPLSHEYLYSEFDRPSAVLTGAISDIGVDTDDDGEYNYLEIGVEINVTEAGYYEVGVSRLLDVNYYSIYIYDSEYLYLYNGTQVVHLSLDGLQIHLSGLNPKYVDHIWLRDENYRYIGKLDDVPLSREYSYKEFEAPSAVFTDTIHDRGVDTDGDGAFNYLEVGLEVNVTDPGTYEVHVDGLRDEYGNWIGVHGSAIEYLEVGTQVLNVSLNGLTIYLSELNPSSISYASLWDQKYNQIDTLSDVPLSREYSYDEFERPGAVLTGVIYDEGVDTDDDGTYDYLKIGVQVNVTDAGNYHVSISGLQDSTFEKIDVYDSNFTFLETGLQNVSLYLEGPTIYLSGRNPIYVNYIELWDENYTYHDYLERVALSREYSYTEFDPPSAMLTGKIYDRGVDTDGDGAFDYLEIGVEINVNKPGNYQVYVSGLWSEVEEPYDREKYYIDVWGSASGYFDVGLGVLNVSLDGRRIYASRSNPRYVNYISLYADYPSYLYDVPLSREYFYTEFEFAAILTGVIFDRGVDTDADGTYDYLEIGVQVNVSDPSAYELYVSGLLDANYYWINVRDTKTVYLNTGVHVVYLYLYGPQIYVSRRNPTRVSYISLRERQDTYYYWYYDSLSDVPLSRQYNYTEFDAPFLDVQTKFIVYPDGRVAVEGALNYTNMVPENTPRYTTAQGFFNLTGDELSSQASAGLTLNLPTEVASEFPFNSTTAQMLAEYSNGLLDLGINSTMILPPVLGSQYPFNSTDGTLKATYSEGVLNMEVEGNTTLPPDASRQFPFNSTDLTVVGTYSPHTLNGTITFSVIDEFTFDDVNVDFTGTQTDFTLNGTVHVVFNVPLGDFIVHNETELIQMIDQLKSDLVGEDGIVWNMTGGLLNVTNLDISYVLNGIGATVTFKMDVHGDFVRALAYVMSGGRNEMLLYPALNEAYESVLGGSFDIRYDHNTQEASVKLTFSYDLNRLIDYILTTPTGTTAFVMTSYSMSPTLWIGDVVFVKTPTNAGDITAHPETGDIIAFYAPSGGLLNEMYPTYQRVVVHRAINKTFVNGTWHFQTKGDANYSPDYWTGNNTYNGMVSENYLIGNVSFRIPFLGYVLSYPNYPYYYYYGYPYLQSTVVARMSLLKALFSSVENMSVQLSYSSEDNRFNFQLTLVDRLKALGDELALIFPDTLPPDTLPELKSFVESLLNTTYASVNTAQASLSYENGMADFRATATIEGDLNAELNYVKDLYFQLAGAQYSRYNITLPWQVSFMNQTEIDISNLRVSAKLDETSFEGRIEGLTLLPPMDAVNATHFKLERFFNLTAPQYQWQREFPGENQRLKITVEGGSNASHTVMIFRPKTVPEPELGTSYGKSMIWLNQTLSDLKDLVFRIKTLLLGDVNGDTVVDISDIALAAKAFGSYPGHPRWNIVADVNEDGKVDIKDLALIAKNFGKTYP